MTGGRAAARARANERWHAATAARSPSCHCYSVVKERTAYPCGEAVGAAGTRTQLSSRARLYRPPRYPYRQRPRASGAASGIRTRVLALARRDPSAGRWPRKRGASGRPRTDNLRFTKPALLPIELRRQWQAPRELNPASRFWRPARRPWYIGACALARAPPLGTNRKSEEAGKPFGRPASRSALIMGVVLGVGLHAVRRDLPAEGALAERIALGAQIHGCRWGRFDLAAVPPCMRQEHHSNVNIKKPNEDVKR
jgi:hypothetical protein